MDPDPAFLSKSGSGYGTRIVMTKNWRKENSRNCFLFFFWLKIAVYLSLGLHKGRPSYRRSLQPSKENIQHCKRWNLLTVFYFPGQFLPSWIRIRIGNLRIADLDTVRIQGLYWIRIQSGSTTLVFTQCYRVTDPDDPGFFSLNSDPDPGCYWIWIQTNGSYEKILLKFTYKTFFDQNPSYVSS